MTFLSFYVGSRIVEVAAPGPVLNKTELGALATYLQVASRYAPDTRASITTERTPTDTPTAKGV